MTTNTSLPRSTPEAQGVPSASLLALLDGFTAAQFNMHSLMLLRHGQVIAEGWWRPYSPDCKRYVYSLSKSFNSSAVGFAAAEGLLTVEDKVISFFPDDLPAEISANLAAMRVKDLLTMTTGHAQDTTGALLNPAVVNWVQTILSLPVDREPGTLFVYNSGASYLLSAIVQTVTGQTVLDYLIPRLFQPLDITDITWESCPRGIITGGWGLSIRTEDIAKFGLLYAQKGMWNGKQLLPAAWVEEASAAVVRNDGEGRENEPADWSQGYGYQFWHCQHNAYRGDGAFGQYCIVMPEQDAVLVMTSETSDMQGIMDLVWQHLLPAMQAAPLPELPKAQDKLLQRLAGLAMPLPGAVSNLVLAAELSGKTFHMAANRTGIETISFTFGDDGCTFHLREDAGEHSIRCGNGVWVPNKSMLPFLKPTMMQLGFSQKPRHPYKLAAAGTWSDPQTYYFTMQYLETPHAENITCHFEGDIVTMEVKNSLVDPNSPMAQYLETEFIGQLE